MQHERDLERVVFGVFLRIGGNSGGHHAGGEGDPGGGFAKSLEERHTHSCCGVSQCFGLYAADTA